MDYIDITFIIYLCRWVISGIVMLPFLWVLSKYIKSQNQYVNLIVVQVIGAFIFYRIDAYIFK